MHGHCCSPETRGGVRCRWRYWHSRARRALDAANAEGPTAVLLTGGSVRTRGRGVGDAMARGARARPDACRRDPEGVHRGRARPRGGGHRQATWAGRGLRCLRGGCWGHPVRGRRSGRRCRREVARARARHAGRRLRGHPAGRRRDHRGDRGRQRIGRRARGGRRGAGRPHGERGELLRSSELLGDMPQLPAWAVRPDQSTTLAHVCTDAVLDKRGRGIVARIASAGIARAVDPAFTPFDGDVAFCLASGAAPPAPPGPATSWSLMVLGTAAATLTAAAIRDAVREAASRSSS